LRRVVVEKSTIEEALKGSLLSSLSDPRYFIMFSAFGLYWDLYSHLVLGKGLLHLAYKLGDAFPLGILVLLIASFSLLAAVISPAVFWICNNLFWDLWFRLPLKIRPDLNASGLPRSMKGLVSIQQLKLWAIKKNNSLAMAMAKEKEELDHKAENNRPQPFLLAMCICGDYFLASTGVLRYLESILPIRHYIFLILLLLFVAVLIYVSFTEIGYCSRYVYLPDLKEHIDIEGKES
jgi:hypothetical protein